MADILSVEGLSKKYRRAPAAPLGGSSFRALVSDGARRLFGRAPRGGDGAAAEFWALRDVSFSLPEGARLGVIGRNGAGKSTLLRVLSRITEPSAGRVRIRGRTASLLEIGTGFHPELTGRENIYLNGALLGMGRAEVRRKLEEIVAFAELEAFLDEPVKHYSSGMYVRLGFAIAAHVDPEILILDEVLAVGDLRFQRKCFGKMQELGQAARSVIFVSHDLAAVSALCERCIVLEAGRIAFDGPAAQAIALYFQQNPLTQDALEAAARMVGDSDGRLLAAEIVDAAGRPALQADISQPVTVRMRYWVSGGLPGPAVPNLHFHRADGSCAFVSMAPQRAPASRGTHVAEVTVPGDFLNEGMYTIGVALTTFLHGRHVIHFYERGALMLNVRDPREPGGLRHDLGYAGEFPGAVRPSLAWTVERVGE
jgi:lipopolysaccharide transport system ATP-binding protein